MRIKLSPFSADETLVLSRSGESITINGMKLDFEALPDGAMLPATATGCPWLYGPVQRIDGGLTLTVRLPHGAQASEQSRFPVDIVNPPDGRVQLPTDFDPKPEQPEVSWPDTIGSIDWSQMVTAEMKREAAAAQHLAGVQAEIAAQRGAADSAIAPLQDAVDLDDATEAEATALKAWKKYRVALNRLPDQPGYPTDIDWPAPPA
ncbi:tail fiber assembly protein [Pseudomonas sp. MF6396]|uniref:tail fiber assembly protein n=1 Tax=Pseudomonas sp. MF6396 TaxID=1960828 RepID=UPI0023788FA3|nr:tail fiber assembly protein [Pseudomonas sp. MF6396]